jgi:hypothetical protein
MFLAGGNVPFFSGQKQAGAKPGWLKSLPTDCPAVP